MISYCYCFVSQRVRRICDHNFKDKLKMENFCGASAQLGPRPTHFCSFYITHNLTHTHTYSVRLLSTIDQSVADGATYTTHNTEISTSSEGFEPVIPAIKRLQTYVLRLHSHWDPPQDLLFVHNWIISQSSGTQV